MKEIRLDKLRYMLYWTDTDTMVLSGEKQHRLGMAPSKKDYVAQLITATLN